MRILYLADTRFPIERANGIQVMETCHALAERGHLVRLLVRPDTARPPRDAFAFYGLTAPAGFRIRHAPGFRAPSTRRIGFLAFTLAEVLKGGARTIDVLLTRDLGVAALLVRLPPATRPPLVYESHGFAPAVARELPSLLANAAPASARKSERLLARERRVWHQAEGYVTITAALAADLVERFGRRDRLAVIPDGVRIAGSRCFNPPVLHEPPRVGYAGHLYPWKGVDVLLQALARLPGVEGLIIGGHPDEPDLAATQALAARLDIAGRITITGLVEPATVASRLSDVDVLVLPNPSTAISSRYTSPLKLFEYMAAGKPIVASDLASIREILRDRDNAILVEPGDAAALAEGIRLALEDRALAAAIARRAFDEAPAYSWQRRAARLEALLDEARRCSSPRASVA